MLASPNNLPLLAELLAEQQRLDTPVARFSAAHERDSFAAGVAQHVALIPLTTPRPEEQYAFEVDLDSCTGCKSCVAACHSLNGLDETETWRDVGLLVSPSRAHPFTQTITTACHHCADPGCLNGCPVLAYEKDPITGIVRHLDDQCIGCSYCILKCPYDAPKYSKRLGIVRKCDMCHGRLAAGEAPACAQACPTHAIRIVTVSKPETGNRRPEVSCANSGECGRDARAPREESEQLSGVRSPASGFLATSLVLPCSPDTSYTRPTTRYIARRTLPQNIVPADVGTLRPQPPHWPLVLMLTLVPAAVGLAGAGALVQLAARSDIAVPAPHLAIASLVSGALGLVASVFHLGQPLRAWRIFLGWRTSWLSREAMIFGVWLAAGTAALLAPQLLWASAALGVLGLACSAMIYIDTGRSFWRAEQTLPRFLGTAAVVGLSPVAPLPAAALLLLKITWESRTHFDHSVSARLQRGPLARAVLTRDLLAGATVILLTLGFGWLAFPLLLAGELAERYLFFRAVDAPKMPGMPA